MRYVPTRMQIFMAMGFVLASFLTPPAQAEPFKLGAERKETISDPEGQYQYPAPAAYPTQEYQGGAQQQAPIRANISTSKRPPLKLEARKTLPPGLMGKWLVRGQLQSREGSQPQYQEAVPRIFRTNTQNVWTLKGNPKKGYFFSNEEGAKSPLFVEKATGNTAFIRYGHPVGNCVAQEAVVMQLSPDGMEFKGLEKITIGKKGENWRMRAKYQLVGVRQR